MGPCAGGAVYSPAMTDFIFMVNKTSYMFVTGPDVVKTVTHESVTHEQLGGASTHTTKSSVADGSFKNDIIALKEIRRLFDFIPLSFREKPPINKTNDKCDRSENSLNTIVPKNPNKPYDMKEVIAKITDDGDFFEIQENYAKNIITGFARMDGHSVGIVANQPLVLAGCLDIDSSRKAARFVRFCDCFNIPIITFVDVPGYLPGTEQEHGGAIRHGSKLLYAYCEATVPKITIIIRKAYGGAYCAMGSKYSKSDINLAWFSAEIAVMGPEAALNMLYKKELSQDKTNKIRSKLLNQYREQFANPYIAAGTGIIDEVIIPEDTKNKIVKSLEMLEEKREIKPLKKHGNIQL